MTSTAPKTARRLPPAATAAALGAAGPVAAGAVPGPVPTGELMQVVLGMLVVLAAIGLTVWLLRRVSRVSAGASGAVRILGGVSLGTRERAVLMQVGGTQLLVGVAPGRVQTLCVLPEPVTVADARPAGGFAERLAGMLARQREAAAPASRGDDR